VKMSLTFWKSAPRGPKLTAPTRWADAWFADFSSISEWSPDGFAAAAVTIHDQPRFPWRGLMIDSARHFIPLEVIKRNLDGMEAVKMNVFHWHLSENQGFRVESRNFRNCTIGLGRPVLTRRMRS